MDDTNAKKCHDDIMEHETEWMDTVASCDIDWQCVVEGNVEAHNAGAYLLMCTQLKEDYQFRASTLNGIAHFKSIQPH